MGGHVRVVLRDEVMQRDQQQRSERREGGEDGWRRGRHGVWLVGLESMQGGSKEGYVRVEEEEMHRGHEDDGGRGGRNWDWGRRRCLHGSGEEGLPEGDGHVRVVLRDEVMQRDQQQRSERREGGADG